MNLLLAGEILFTWALVITLSIAAGLPVAYYARCEGPLALRVSLWSGLGLMTLAVLVASLFTGLRSSNAAMVSVAIPLVTGLITILYFGTGWLRKNWTSRLSLIALAALLVTVAALALGSSLAPSHYDFYLYHHAAISWAGEYGTVPGLANLQDPLGYANSSFPWSALLQQGPALDRGYSAFVGIWISALILDTWLRVVTREGARKPGALVSITGASFVLVPVLVFADMVSASPTSDAAVFALIIASSASLADAVFRSRSASTDALLALLPLAIACTMRPQVLIILLASILVITLWVPALTSKLRRVPLTFGPWFVLALSIALGLVVAVRDYRLSGWLLYPMSFFSFDVPWLAEDPSTLRSLTVGIARDPSDAYQQAAGGWGWLFPWVLQQTGTWEFWYFTLPVVTGCILLLLAARRTRDIQLRRLGVTALPLVVFVAIWIFALPPTWRLAWGAAFGLGSLLVGWAFWQLGMRPESLLVIASMVVAVTAATTVWVRYPTKPAEPSSFATKEFTTHSGLKLTTPRVGDQCGMAALLCTPTPRVDLILLETTLDDGFGRLPSIK